MGFFNPAKVFLGGGKQWQKVVKFGVEKNRS
jgi:hypothetical protein